MNSFRNRYLSSTVLDLLGTPYDRVVLSLLDTPLQSVSDLRRGLDLDDSRIRTILLVLRLYEFVDVVSSPCDASSTLFFARGAHILLQATMPHSLALIEKNLGDLGRPAALALLVLSTQGLTARGNLTRQVNSRLSGALPPPTVAAAVNQLIQLGVVGHAEEAAEITLRPPGEDGTRGGASPRSRAAALFGGLRTPTAPSASPSAAAAKSGGEGRGGWRGRGGRGRGRGRGRDGRGAPTPSATGGVAALGGLDPVGLAGGGGTPSMVDMVDAWPVVATRVDSTAARSVGGAASVSPTTPHAGDGGPTVVRAGGDGLQSSPGGVGSGGVGGVGSAASGGGASPSGGAAGERGASGAGMLRIRYGGLARVLRAHDLAEYARVEGGDAAVVSACLLSTATVGPPTVGGPCARGVSGVQAVGAEVEEGLGGGGVVGVDALSERLQLPRDAAGRVCAAAAENPVNFVVGAMTSPPAFGVDLHKAATARAAALVEAHARRRYGVVAARVFFFLRRYGYLDAKQLAATVMVSPEECNKQLLVLYRAGLVCMNSMPKHGDGASGKVVVVWSVSLSGAVATVIDSAYHAAFNVRKHVRTTVDLVSKASCGAAGVGFGGGGGSVSGRGDRALGGYMYGAVGGDGGDGGENGEPSLYRVTSRIADGAPLPLRRKPYRGICGGLNAGSPATAAAVGDSGEKGMTHAPRAAVQVPAAAVSGMDVDRDGDDEDGDATHTSLSGKVVDGAAVVRRGVARSRFALQKLEWEVLILDVLYADGLVRGMVEDEEAL